MPAFLKDRYKREEQRGVRDSWINVILALSFFFQAFSAGAGEIAPNRCVEMLYRRGGVSLLSARDICSESSDEEALHCQNALFLEAGFHPLEAWGACKARPSRRFTECVIDKAARRYLPQSQAAEECLKEDLSGYPEYETPEPHFAPRVEGSPGSSRPTVCSITINSNDEADTFRQVLSSRGFDFVELVPDWRGAGKFLPRDDRWLGKTCAQVPRCDILVASGHFAGIFLGEAGFELSLGEMQRLSCSQSCPGLFQSVKEVFLFGCNTLADKGPDSRSFEQYRDILIADGLSPADAEIASARRYTPYGRSSLEYMRAIFPNALAIHGFPSISPSGPNIRQSLREYLEKRVARSRSADSWWDVKSFRGLNMRVSTGDPVMHERMCSLQGYKGMEAFTRRLTESLKKGDLLSEAFDLARGSSRLTSTEAARVKSETGGALARALTRIEGLGRRGTSPSLTLGLLEGLGASGLIRPDELRVRKRSAVLSAIAGRSGDQIPEIICRLGFAFHVAGILEPGNLPSGLSQDQAARVRSCLRRWD